MNWNGYDKFDMIVESNGGFKEGGWDGKESMDFKQVERCWVQFGRRCKRLVVFECIAWEVTHVLDTYWCVVEWKGLW